MPFQARHPAPGQANRADAPRPARVPRVRGLAGPRRATRAEHVEPRRVDGFGRLARLPRQGSDACTSSSISAGVIVRIAPRHAVQAAAVVWPTWNDVTVDQFDTGLETQATGADVVLACHGRHGLLPRPSAARAALYSQGDEGGGAGRLRAAHHAQKAAPARGVCGSRVGADSTE
jgi:hypothetical protein